MPPVFDPSKPAAFRLSGPMRYNLDVRSPGPLVWRIAITLTAVTAVSGFGMRADQRTPLLKSIDSLLAAARYDSARTLTMASMHEVEARGDSTRLAPLVFRYGRVSVTLGDQPIARRELDRAMRLAQAAHDTVSLASALLFRGFVHRDMGEVDMAMANFARARDLAHMAHATRSEAEAVYNLAYRDLRLG